jgi:DNA-binding NarL/FixJ family response regulator
MRRTTILIADDHTIVVEGLVRLLKDQFDVVGGVSDAAQLLEAAARLRPDVILTDVSMPGLSGIEALRRLKAERSDTKVIVLTMHADAELATEAVRAGASGFLIKHSAGEELFTAIQEVLQGRIYLTPAITREVLSRMAYAATRPESRLTPRQREVLRLIAEGRRMKEIAGLLNLSPRTVETHKYEMMQSLGIQSTAELVRYAVQHRLVGE